MLKGAPGVELEDVAALLDVLVQLDIELLEFVAVLPDACEVLVAVVQQSGLLV